MMGGPKKSARSADAQRQLPGTEPDLQSRELGDLPDARGQNEEGQLCRAKRGEPKR